jgi:hypothetical protein
MTKKLILGCCATGAKFTPLNHRDTGDELLDRICSGRDIARQYRDVAEELGDLQAIGCRYYHYHARNPDSGEQTTDNHVYRAVGRLAYDRAPRMMLSWGASRNGSEVLTRIGRLGEWERVSQAGLPIAKGGADFITMQAAIELQIIRDLENQTQPITLAHVASKKFIDQVRAYRPSYRLEEVVMETNSTAHGSNYGCSSPAIQMETYGRAIAARRRLDLLHEVEWVQLDRSLAMTRFAIERSDLALASEGQLNITLLFGFSPKMPFPQTYDEFAAAVRAAKSLEYDIAGRWRRHVTVSVGAAVLPQHAGRHFGSFDEGRRPIEQACAVQRLIAYAARPHSDVDIVRVGMEDTPYMMDAQGAIRPTSNVELATAAAAWIAREGAEISRDTTILGRTNNLATLAA